MPALQAKEYNRLNLKATISDSVERRQVPVGFTEAVASLRDTARSALLASSNYWSVRKQCEYLEERRERRTDKKLFDTIWAYVEPTSADGVYSVLYRMLRKANWPALRKGPVIPVRASKRRTENSKLYRHGPCAPCLSVVVIQVKFKLVKSTTKVQAISLDTSKILFLKAQSVLSAGSFDSAPPLLRPRRTLHRSDFAPVRYIAFSFRSGRKRLPSSGQCR
jgi:hypothetical protein